jgi:hypothetical protein
VLTQAEFRTLCQGEIGKPYIWGAEGPAAYDCSGLAQWALAKLQLDPPGDQTAEGLYRWFLKRGAAIDLADCALGDLVFFGGASAVTHVGLGWGDAQMFEAGGGDRSCTTVEVARAKGAEVRLRPVTRRRDRVAILRPRALAWREDPSRAMAAAGAGFGAYEGTPATRWLDDGRHMQLLEPFAYMTEAGAHWPVPADVIVDGASIPAPFWSVIGGPFEGRYRNASIIHDYYCDSRTRPWKDVHRMFYVAMRCSGVAALKAKVMFYAVYRFGPRWAELGPSMSLELPFETAAAVATAAPPVTMNGFDRASSEADVAAIVAQDPDLAGIEALADEREAGRG